MVILVRETLPRFLILPAREKEEDQLFILSKER
jgi:hypothetical protein